jgi:cysteinyl-tRNA synthetase
LDALEDALAVAVNQEATDEEKAFEKQVMMLRNEFVDSMDNDFNTPKALAALFELSKEINKFLDQNKKVSETVLQKAQEVFSGLGKALGLFQTKRTKAVGEKLVDDLVELLFSLREQLRKKGEYGLSDEIRAKMKEFGLVIEDTAEGPKWKLA